MQLRPQASHYASTKEDDIIYRSSFRKARFIAGLLILLLTLSAIPVQVNVGAGPITKVDWFEGGVTQKDILFSAPGTDSSSLSLSFQTGVSVKDATFKVDGAENGGEYPSNITIDVGGDGTPEWRFGGEGYGALGHQEMFILGGLAENTSANLTIIGGGGNNDTAAIRLPYGAVVNSADMEVEVKGVSIAIECKTGSRSCDNLNNDPVYSLKSLFAEEGWNADIVNGGDIDTVAELNQYTVVILGSSGHGNDHDHTTFQTALKQWVQNNGGGLVGTGWLLYATAANSDLDDVLPVSPGYSYSMSGQVTITDTNHPITHGVNNFNIASQAYCEYPSSGSADPGASIQGTCSGPAIVSWQTGVGRGIYLGPNYYGAFETYNSEAWYSDANSKQLMKNAALWASGGGSLSGYIDVGNDGNKEWDKQDFNGSEVLPDFTSTINDYLGTAGISGTDEWGNTYVDVPIRVNSTSAGLISLLNLSIDYSYTVTVDANPHNVSLTNELNSFIPPDLGPTNVSIPVHVTSDSPGILKVHSFHCDIVDPSHAPRFILKEPTKKELEIDEDSTVEFRVEAEDWYRYDITFEWYQDGELNTTGNAYDYYADFESMGLHNITVVADNGLESTEYSWSVLVRNVNRPPIIDGNEPELTATVEENTTTTFSVDAYDPDLTDHIGYAWLLDGMPVGGRVESYDYSPGFKDQGFHDLKCIVQDQRSLRVEIKWDIEVINVNAPPVIYSANPKGEPSMNENSTLNFLVKANNEDDDPLTYQWYVDDEVQDGAVRTTFSYITDHEDAGVHDVKVVVSDGTDTATRTWPISVIDVNRPPVPVIAQPEEFEVFITVDNITLSAEGSSDPDGDPLSYEWFEGTTKLGTGEEVMINLDKGSHKIMLVIDDGREGISSRTVNLIVNKVDFDIEITPGLEEPLDGDELTFDVTLDNSGNGEAQDLVVKFMVDDEVVGSETISSTSPGDVHNLKFTWNAKEGDHVIKVLVLDVESERNIDVGPAPIIRTGVGGQDWSFLIILLLVIIITMVLVGVMVARRRKRSRAVDVLEEPAPAQPAAPASPYPGHQPTVHQSYHEVPPPQPAPSQYTSPPPPPSAAPGHVPYPAQQPSGLPPPPPSHIPRATARPLPPPPPPPPPVARPTTYRSYDEPAAIDDGTQAEIERVENALYGAEEQGQDTRRARNFMKLAKTFQKKGLTEKTLQYCHKAEAALRP